MTTSADGMVRQEVEQLAIKLWIEWLGFQDGAQTRMQWSMNSGHNRTVAMALEWANQGQDQRNAWYAVAERALELANG